MDVVVNTVVAVPRGVRGICMDRHMREIPQVMEKLVSTHFISSRLPRHSSSSPLSRLQYSVP